MPSDESSGLLDRATIVVASSLAARQWEAWLSAEAIERRARAWLAPAVIGYRAWTEQLWLQGGAQRPLPLTGSQSNALWRRLIANSAAGAELLGHGGAAEWAADAWRLLCHWRIDPASEQAGSEQSDYRAFLRWCAAYREVLAARGWIDAALLDAELATAALPKLPAELVLAELDDPTPVQAALVDAVAAAGCGVVHWRAAPRAAAARRARLADAADELRTAVAWAAARLEAEPAARIALVVSGLAERHAEVERALAEVSTDGGSALPTWHGGQPLAAQPLISAALGGIALLQARATFETFSRWLRSPWFGAADLDAEAARANLEVALRLDVRAKLPFAEAYRDAGLADRLRQDAPDVDARLARAFAEIGGRRLATPSGWARLWQRALNALGWTPPGGADDPGLLQWHAALDELARLTPVTGDLEQDAALEELERVLERPQVARLPLAGIHVFARLEEVGPGYAGAWITGFTDTFWPEPMRLNPLLPRALQRAHAMPGSTPQATRAQSQRTLDRLGRFVPELIASWPNRVYDYETEPSPAIRSWPELTAEQLEPLRRRRRPRTTETRRETVPDPPPALRGTELRGGAGVLGRQARCPVRAFCQDRLRARALEPLAIGLSALQRGNVAHRALELLFDGQPAQQDLGALRAAIDTRVEQALAHVFREARRPLHTLFELERERLARLLAELVDLDAKRAPFRVAAVEQRRIVRVGAWTLEIRVDRLDRLADGRVAIIDHKTGDRASAADWLRERLRDAQVPLYAAYSDEPVGAVAIARVSGRSASYLGLWEAGMFPGRPQQLPDGRSWPQQLEIWRAQIEGLVSEFAAGDTRLLLADVREAEREYAPLTRVVEQLGLLGGSVSPW